MSPDQARLGVRVRVVHGRHRGREGRFIRRVDWIGKAPAGEVHLDGNRRVTDLALEVLEVLEPAEADA